MNEAILKRTKDTGVETLGTLSAVKDGKTFSCVTLELPDKKNQRRISCIPKGKYLCKYSYMASRRVNHYLLQSVPGRDGIFIHAGTYHSDFLGCVGLGYSYADFNKDGEADIANSRKAVADFENFMSKEDFWLIIS